MKDKEEQQQQKKTGHFIEPVTNASLGRAKPISSGMLNKSMGLVLEFIQYNTFSKGYDGYKVVSVIIKPSGEYNRYDVTIEYEPK